MPSSNGTSAPRALPDIRDDEDDPEMTNREFNMALISTAGLAMAIIALVGGVIYAIVEFIK